MPRALSSTVTVALLAVSAPLQPDALASSAADARSYVMTSFNLTAADLDRIDRGHVFTRTLPAPESHEIDTIGVVRLQASAEDYVARLRDIVHFKQDAAILQIGVFSNTPTVAEMAGLTLDDADIRDMRDCRVGRCGVRLSAPGLERLRDEVDWKKPDASQRATAWFRQMLADYAAEYLRSGSGASMEYADRPTPLNVAREFASLAASNQDDCQQFPLLRRHLIEFPNGRAPDTSDIVYWSKERIGRRGVVSITHLAILRSAGDAPVEYVIGSKQLYASHYFDASLGVTVLVSDRSASTPSTYLVYVNRSRLDVFGGMLGGVARAIISSRARAVGSEQLTKLQRTVHSIRSARMGEIAAARPAGMIAAKNAQTISEMAAIESATGSQNETP
jgi:hypothetical protein